MIPQIYPITDTGLSGLSHAEQVKRLIAGGATLIQLREKHASPREFYQAALEAVSIARRHNAAIIINDRIDIALAVKADGVHLGQDDMPPEKARRVLGDDAILGFSTHTIRQVEAATHFPVDYIAFGPIFGTKTKADTEPVVGLDGLREARKAAGDLPLVAIGGIDEANIPQVFEAGADSAAMIGALISDPEEIAARMQRYRILGETNTV